MQSTHADTHACTDTQTHACTIHAPSLIRRSFMLYIGRFAPYGLVTKIGEKLYNCHSFLTLFCIRAYCID